MTSLAFFAALGLPGLSGFVSEVLCFMGGFKTFRLYTIVSVSGVVLTAAYMLWTYQRVFLGPVNEKYKALPEINARELATLVPLAVITVLVGIYPKFALDLLNTSMTALSKVIEAKTTAGL
jgi:NADH-quinone oxidoreductase subunit M